MAAPATFGAQGDESASWEMSGGISKQGDGMGGSSWVAGSSSVSRENLPNGSYEQAPTIAAVKQAVGAVLELAVICRLVHSRPFG